MTDYSNNAQRSRLEALFPRGRFDRLEDGMPVLVSRRRALKGTHLFEQAPGTLLGLAYLGNWTRWRDLLGPHIVRHVRGDEEGFIHLAWTPEVAKRLRTFSKGRGSGQIPSRKPAQTPTGEPRSPANPEPGHRETP